MFLNLVGAVKIITRRYNDNRLRVIFQDNPDKPHQNVAILDCIGAKDDGGGGDHWSYKMCKASVKSSSTTNQHPAFYRPDALSVVQPSVSEH